MVLETAGACLFKMIHFVVIKHFNNFHFSNVTHYFVVLVLDNVGTLVNYLICTPEIFFFRSDYSHLEPWKLEKREWWPLLWEPPWWVQCIPYGKTGLNMATVGFICACLLFRALFTPCPTHNVLGWFPCVQVTFHVKCIALFSVRSSLPCTY